MRVFVSLLAAAAFLAFGAVLAGAQDGTALYQKNCASCHGPDGKAQTPAGKAMKAPAIAGTKLTPEQVVEKLKTIDKHKSVVSKLSDAELMAIAKAIPPGS
jgi:mono/diheme cytochrome c family protein